MRQLPRIVLGAFAGFCFLAGATHVQAATESGVYVEFRASELCSSPPLPLKGDYHLFFVKELYFMVSTRMIRTIAIMTACAT